MDQEHHVREDENPERRMAGCSRNVAWSGVRVSETGKGSSTGSSRPHSLNAALWLLLSPFCPKPWWSLIPELNV